MSKPVKQMTSAEQQALIASAVASVRRRSRPQPKNDNGSLDAALQADPTSIATDASIGEDHTPARRAAFREAQHDSEPGRPEAGHDAGEHAGRLIDKDDGDAPPPRRSSAKKKPRRKVGDYEVGYGKPPVHSRFQPGQCGNPKGRPKNSRNVKTHMEEVYFQPTTVRRDGKTRKVPLFRALLEVQAQKAAAGDLKALASIMRDIVTYFGADLLQTAAPEQAVVDDDDLGISSSEREMLAYCERDRLLRLGLSEADAEDLLRDMGLAGSSSSEAPGAGAPGQDLDPGDEDMPDDDDDSDMEPVI